MIRVVAVHDSNLTNKEYKTKIIKKYSFLLSGTFDLHVYKLDEIENLPFDGSSYHHIYLDINSIIKSDERVLKTMVKFNSARVIWITVNNSASARTNPDKKGKRNQTFTSGIVKSMKTGD